MSLVDCLSDPSPDVRGTAAFLCGLDGLDATIIAPALHLQLAHDQDGLTRLAAAISLYVMRKLEKKDAQLVATGLEILKKVPPQADEDELLEWGESFYRFAKLVGSR